ncbi:hypothetical protein [Streptomyces sp. NPDC059010]|uniref:hypothetical protein n=1 Tax=Streptomyces sp. NPDC059010 TaxID=3346695 RepID=UPI003689AE10
MVTPARMYSLGGTGQGEMFRARGAVAATLADGSYFTVSRSWRRGDRVTILAPYRLRIERALDDPAVQSLFYGAVLLVARSPEPDLRAFSFYKRFTLRGDLADAIAPEGRSTPPASSSRRCAPLPTGGRRRGGSPGRSATVLSPLRPPRT